MGLNGRILFCGCVNTKIISDGVKSKVLGALGPVGDAVSTVPDLCEVAANCDPLLAELAELDELTIVACHPRAVKWLFERAGVELSDEKVRFVNMKSDEIDSVLKEIFGNAEAAGHEVEMPESDGKSDWIPWFPVIDYERCVNCGQCLDFCLFGVYEKDEQGKVTVANPQNCKTNCPACARICPDAAIIFPKVGESPIDGAEVKDEDAVRANIKINVDKLLGGDPYAALMERKKKRKKLLVNRESMERAYEERQSHLKGEKQ